MIYDTNNKYYVVRRGEDYNGASLSCGGTLPYSSTHLRNPDGKGAWYMESPDKTSSTNWSKFYADIINYDIKTYNANDSSTRPDTRILCDKGYVGSQYGDDILGTKGLTVFNNTSIYYNNQIITGKKRVEDNLVWNTPGAGLAFYSPDLLQKIATYGYNRDKLTADEKVQYDQTMMLRQKIVDEIDNINSNDNITIPGEDTNITTENIYWITNQVTPYSIQGFMNIYYKAFCRAAKLYTDNVTAIQLNMNTVNAGGWLPKWIWEYKSFERFGISLIFFRD